MANKFFGTQTFDIEEYVQTNRLREVGSQAVWSLSSCKPGFGIEQLRENSCGSFWQSDDAVPHFISIQFKRKMLISDICIYMDYKNDESYTPNKISIRAGAHFHDLTEIELVELQEPNGWVKIQLQDRNDRMVKAFMIQIVILSNHQNGKDTHLRQIKVHSPIEQSNVHKTIPQLDAGFSSSKLSMYSIR